MNKKEVTKFYPTLSYSGKTKEWYDNKRKVIKVSILVHNANQLKLTQLRLRIIGLHAVLTHDIHGNPYIFNRYIKNSILQQRVVKLHQLRNQEIKSRKDWKTIRQLHILTSKIRRA